MNKPLKAGKLLKVIHYHSSKQTSGEVGIVVDVVANKPCLIFVFEVQKEKGG